jgi:hypothetical protein
MANHLIVGLGGTGGKIIRSFRKTIYNEFRTNNPDGVDIGYLYMDTSDEMMGMDNPSWKVLGHSVQLDEGSKVHIKPAGLMDVLGNINQYPGIRDWIGNIDNWNEYFNGQVGLETAGGQRRRLGRFILASNISSFQHALQTQVNKLTNKSGQADLHFHICCGLAGGTGAGTLLDVISLIRKQYNPTSVSKYKIILYLFLPEENPKPGWDSGFYHSNGYAALYELNALGVGTYLPIDISHSNPNTSSRFESVENPYNGCYLFTNVNENGNKVDTDVDVPNIISDLLYQKLVSVKDEGWLRDKLGRQENHENYDAKPEQSSESKTPERSVRFLTFGVKRIAIPEQEIKEYITYNYANQVILQLRYNNWSDETGFRDEPVNQNFGELIANKKTHENWRTTDEHFQLSLPVIDDTISKNWRKIGDVWRFVIPEYKSTAKENKDKNWLDELKKLCDKQFMEQYRNMGVKKFYEAKQNDKNDLAKEIVGRVHKDLFSEWQNGTKSLLDIRRIIDELIDNLHKRYKEIDDKIVKNQEHEERELANALENEKTWAKIGMLSSLFGKKAKLLDAQATVFESIYIYKTTAEALRFSKILMSQTIEHLNNLRAEIDKANQTLDAALKDFNKNIEERIKDEDENRESDEIFKKQVVRFYEPAEIKAITKRLIRDKKEQNTQTSVVRTNIVTKLGDHPGFKTFNERISKSVLINQLESDCEVNAINAEANLDTDSRIFDIGILGKLKERYDGNRDELRKFLKKLVDFSGYFLTFDKNEELRSGDGANKPAMKKSITVILPKMEDAFTAEFIETITSVIPPGIEASFIKNDDLAKRNEIVILTLVNGFPLRSVEVLKTLKRRYDDKLAQSDGEKSKLFLHTENIAGYLPRLFIPSQTEIEQENKDFQQKAIKYIILGYCMNLIQKKENENGYEKFALVEKDRFGSYEPKFFMETLLSESNNLITKNLYKDLVNSIQPELDNNYKHKDKKEELSKQIFEFVNFIRTERNAEDSIFKDYKKQASTLLDDLKV